MKSMNEEQLRFFRDEVLELFGWDDEANESGIDPLEFVRQEVKDLKTQEILKLRSRNRLLEKELASLLCIIFLQDLSITRDDADRVAEKVWETWEEVEKVAINENN